MDAEQSQNRKRRGRTLMKNIKRLKVLNEKLPLEWNQHGEPHGKNRKQLSSYMGVVARNRTDITKDWDNQEDHIKDSMLRQITVVILHTQVLLSEANINCCYICLNFNVLNLQDVFEIPENRRGWVLANLGERARRFRVTLTKYVFDEAGNKNPLPPRLYDFVDHEQWAAFTADRDSDAFKVRT